MIDSSAMARISPLGTVMHSMVIIGAAQAGGWVAKTLRDGGFDGKITLIGDEPYLPYERPPLSKDVLLGRREAQSTALWKEDQFDALKIKFFRGVRAERIDRSSQTVALSNGLSVQYDRLAITTGSRVRRLSIPSENLAGIHYLRGIDDALRVATGLAKCSRILIVGGGWIGLETAAVARKKGISVTLVEAAHQLCGRVLPADLAGLIESRHKSCGAEIHLETSVVEFLGEGKLQGALLSNGLEIECDLAVVGIGAVPNAELADGCGLEVTNGIVVDESGRTSDPLVFAAGDVANQPDGQDGRIRLESWQNAQNQAIVVGKSMLGTDVQYKELPYFWSDQGDDRIQIVGSTGAECSAVYRGSIEDYRFTTLFLKKRRLAGAVAFNNPQDIAAARRLIQRGVELDTDAIRVATNLTDLLRTPASTKISN